MAASRDEVIANPSKASLRDDGRVASDGLTIDALVAQHYEFIWRILRGLGLSNADAEDATQQVFMIAARKLDTIDPDRARSFVYGAALRVANNARRGLRRRREVLDDELPEEPEPEARGPEKMAELDQARRLLAQVLDRLEEKHRRVIVLAEIEQLEVPEIAALEGVPVGTAASRLRVAREKFRAALHALRDQN
ncbi:MAG TPA: sigma-70 family RNA polymerase sigma factor, partial [Polyangiaceae bacterium]|nr:sigma-70 family RNA polymerase sigma factor [Polyangiaceae bacterium]